MHIMLSILSLIVVNFWGTILEFLDIRDLWIFLKNVKFIPFIVLTGGIVIVPRLLPTETKPRLGNSIDNKKD